MLLPQTPLISIIVALLKAVKPLGQSLSEWCFTYAVTLLLYLKYLVLFFF